METARGPGGGVQFPDLAPAFPDELGQVEQLLEPLFPCLDDGGLGIFPDRLVEL